MDDKERDRLRETIKRARHGEKKTGKIGKNADGWVEGNSE